MLRTSSILFALAAVSCLGCTPDGTQEIRESLPAAPAAGDSAAEGATLESGRQAATPATQAQAGRSSRAWTGAAGIAGLDASAPATQAPDASVPQGFIHPGLSITREDLARMRANIAARTEPHYAAYTALIADPESQADATVEEPPAVIGRNTASQYASTRYAAESAAVTAFQNALVHALTPSNEVSHANKAIEILNAYARTTQHFDKDDPERDLEAAILGWLWVSAAELVRHSDYTGWSVADVERFDSWIRSVVYADTDYEPSGVLVTPKTNGAGARGAFSLRTKLAIGVYLDDRSIYDAAIDYFFHGQGNGAPEYYVDPQTGQTWEAGRDQGHAQGGLSRLIETAQIANNQGDATLYAWQGFALHRAVEYIASYNLGNAVPYAPMQPYTTDWADVYPMISDEGRGQFATIYELPYSYFHSTLAMDMPNTKQVIDRVGSELFSKNNDDPMLATLTYRR